MKGSLTMKRVLVLILALSLLSTNASGMWNRDRLLAKDTWSTAIFHVLVGICYLLNDHHNPFFYNSNPHITFVSETGTRYRLNRLQYEALSQVSETLGYHITAALENDISEFSDEHLHDRTMDLLLKLINDDADIENSALAYSEDEMSTLENDARYLVCPALQALLERVRGIKRHSVIIDLTNVGILKGNSVTIEHHPVFLNGVLLEVLDGDFYFSGQSIEYIWFKKEKGMEELKLPTNEFRRITQYLSSKRDFPKSLCIDCGFFLFYIKNVYCQFIECDGAPFAFMSNSGGSFVEIPESELIVGDGIRIFQESSGWHHCALYLGEGLFLSKFGESGLVVCALDSMKSFFGFGDSSGFSLARVLTVKECKEPQYAPEVSKSTIEQYCALWNSFCPNPQKLWEVTKNVYSCSQEFREIMEESLKK